MYNCGETNLEEGTVRELSPQGLGAGLILTVALVHLEILLLEDDRQQHHTRRAATTVRTMSKQSQETAKLTQHKRSPHPLQKASPYTLRSLQATFQVLKEHPRVTQRSRVKSQFTN